jgi:hypothetical protein
MIILTTHMQKIIYIQLNIRAVFVFHASLYLSGPDTTVGFEFSYIGISAMI